MRARACGYPLPPHGHQPNFIGAADAAKHLLAHPQLSSCQTICIGPDRVLYRARKLALQAGITVFVPNLKKEGWYWRLTDPKGANLKAMPTYGESLPKLVEIQAVILASVVVYGLGNRLGKGFSWAACGLGLGVPEYTLAHPLMQSRVLPCPADSQVNLIGLPTGVHVIS